MAKKKATLETAIINVLSDGPLRGAEIATRVLSEYQTGLKGKTPAATIASKLYTSAAKGVLVRKVSKGLFELIPDGEKKATQEELKEDAAGPAVTPNSVVLREGIDVKSDPKPSSRRRKRSPVAA